MKSVIIFHSVCGNCYRLGRYLHETLLEKNVDSSMFRVHDPDHEELIKDFPAAGDFYDEINKISLASPDVLLSADLIIMGSPTYFGNVSAEMKTFMDSACGFWIDSRLKNKWLLPFTSCSSTYGGQEMCLNSIRVFGTHMGMTLLSVPAVFTLRTPQPAYGFCHVSGAGGDQRPGEDYKEIFSSYLDWALNAMDESKKTTGG